jgi:hypothetical protein
MYRLQATYVAAVVCAFATAVLLLDAARKKGCLKEKAPRFDGMVRYAVVKEAKRAT